MANTLLKLGGVAVAIGGAYLYMKNKGKKEQEQVLSSMQVAQSSQPNKSSFDRDKASKELAILMFPKIQKPIDKQLMVATTIPIIKTATPIGSTSIATVSTGFPIQKTRTTELSLYKQILEGLNLITDDSDAEFVVNTFKKYVVSNVKDKPDLETEIRLDKINQKYPTALKKLDFG
jgi:hypothetical protein